MADLRIYDLTHNAAPADNDDILLDNATWPEAQYCTKAELLADEVTARDAADTAIEDGAGLETDGSMTAIAGSAYLKNADFLAAGLNVNLKNGLQLLDAALNAITGNLEVEVMFNITSAELLALGAAVGKIPIPGAGTFYWMQRVCAKNNFVSVAYATGGANGIYLRFTGAADYICELDKTFCELAATGRAHFETVRHVLPINTGIEVIAPDGNLVNGDGNIDVIVRYAITPDFTTSSPAASNCCIVPLWDTFVNADLSAMGNIVIHHSLNTQKIICTILDNNNSPVAVGAWTVGDEGGLDINNYITVPIGGPIAGTWTWMIHAIP